ncbi:tetratricopeptide repeat protein [Thiohalorhabdus sp.]|uniref:tetratricopeptide repeat protein n=1 Tax=Thiohalorhabdus sp. TaxID=3094134 RepID=UPI002FC35E08
MPLSDDADKVRLLREDAEAGEARAQRHLANRYLRGKGVEADAEQAAHWMGRAAEGGLATAQRSYGEFLEQGIGIGVDTEAARRWYRQAAEQGDPMARQHLQRLNAAG